MPGPLKTPYGNGPENLAPQQGPTLQDLAPPSFQRAPAAAPAPRVSTLGGPPPSAEPPADPNMGIPPEELAMLKQLRMLAPEERAKIGVAGDAADTFNSEDSNVQGPPNQLSQKLRRTADGQWEVRHKDGDRWRRFSEKESKAINEVLGEFLQSINPAVIGQKTTMGAAELALPIGADLLARGAANRVLPGSGAIAGPAAAAGAAYFMKDVDNATRGAFGVAGESDRSRAGDVALSLGGEALGMAASRAMQGMGQKAANTALGADAAEAAARTGAQGQLAEDAATTGVPLRSDQIDPLNVQAVGQFDRAARANPQAVLDAQEQQWSQVINQIDQLPGVQAAKNSQSAGVTKVADFLDGLKDAYQGTIRKLSQQAREYGMGMTQDPTPLLEQMKAKLGRFQIDLDQAGNLVPGQVLPPEAVSLAKAYARMRNKLTRQATESAIMSETGGHVPGPRNPYMPPGSGDQFGKGHYEMASYPDALPPSSPGAMPDINMHGRYTPPPARAGSYDAAPSPGQPFDETVGRQVDPTVARSQLSPNAAGQGGRGINYGELEGFLDEAQKLANFNKADPSPAEQAWREIYGAASDLRDDFATKIFTSPRVNQPRLAGDLRAYRTLYEESADVIKQVRNTINTNPQNAARALLNPGNPDLAQKVMGIVSPQQKEVLKGQFLENIVIPNMDRMPGRQYVGAKQVQAQWEAAKREPDFINAIYSKEEVAAVDKLLNVARAVEARQVAVEGAMEDPMLKRAVALVVNPKHQMFHKGAEFVAAIFGKQPKLAEMMRGQIYQRYPLTGAQYRQRAEQYLRASSWIEKAQPATAGAVALQGDQ